MYNTGLRAEFPALTASIPHEQLATDAIQTHLQSTHDSITYPVLTLPPEIICEIFLRCLPEERETDVVNPEEAPLLLTHICRVWRQIAISLPTLWTTFEVINIDATHLHDIAKTWFERSQNYRISVKIHGFLWRLENLDSLVEVFSQHSHRMCSLELHLDLEDLLNMNTQLLNFPLLHNLSVCLIDNEEDLRLCDKSIEMFDTVPLLTEVVTELLPSMLCLPWQQLTKFTGDRYTTVRCLEALRCMPNVLECAFSILVFDYDDDDDLEIFSHTNIQHFSLFVSEPHICERTGGLKVLEFVTLPSLQTLQICGEDLDEEELDLFLERSQPPLQKMSVHPSGRTELELSSLLIASNLTELEIWHPGESFLSLFFDSFGSDATLLPQLQTLSLLGCRPEDGELDFSDILEIAAAPITERWNLTQCARLQSFRVVHETRRALYSEELLLPFRNLRAAGMDIYIGTNKAYILGPETDECTWEEESEDEEEAVPTTRIMFSVGGICTSSVDRIALGL
ncbi:hypothetical protein C8R46DRAFT_1093464 [Mycena filopes]|nr:hypothetical protein C8R46DRAFT_1093464 [Mycena filopes]